MAGFDDDWRHQTLEGVLNFRDFGGYGCGGRELPRGRLFRSGHFARASEADVDALHGLGPAIVVDLRTEGERAEQPSRRHADFAGTVIEAAGEQDQAPHEQAAAAGGTIGPEVVRAHMVEAYRELAYRPGIVDAFGRTFEALERTPGPLIIHCAAGKDRTGILVALLQHVAGVSDADILEDYLLTNRVELTGERLHRFGRWLAERYGGEPDEAAVRLALGVEPIFLETTWATMRERNGGVDGYLEQVLGVDARRRAAVRDALHG